MRQLFDLAAVWSPYDHFFVTEHTALGQSVAKEHRAFFVSHVALGQARLGAPFRMLAAGAGNFIQSVKVILGERPDIVITTGAGSVFFVAFVARLVGAKIVMIESFARFDRPSAFARLVAPFAHLQVIQSAVLSRFFPKAHVFDPLRVLDSPRPPKRPLVFVTVGATLPFDRLVKMAAAVKGSGEAPEKFLVQTGVGGVRPDGVQCVETLPFEEVTAVLREADIVICHGGTGSLITALREGCRVIAVPRRFEQGEHYDNHQAEITAAFAARGLIAVANSAAELVDALRAVRAKTPVLATTDHSALVAFLNREISGWIGAGS